MSEPRQAGSRPAARRGIRWPGRVVLALLAALLGTGFVGQAASAAEPPLPEDVAAYFATGLIPRLADLYGPGTGTDAAFDETTTVGTVHRLLAWTPEFLAGKKTDAPTQLTNTWIAPVTAKSGAILGLAAVWINPGSDIVELADFSRGRALVDALGRAPKDTMLIDDAAQQAWFATDGKTLTPLVVGTSKTTAPLTPAEYQKILRANAAQAVPPQTATNPGLLIAGITLGVVVLLLAVFILLPGRKRRNGKADADAPLSETPVVETPVAEPAVAEPAVAEPAVAEPVEANPAVTKPRRSFAPDPEPVAAPKRSFEPDPEPATPATQRKAPQKKAPQKQATPKQATPAKTPATTAAQKPAPKAPTGKTPAGKTPTGKMPAGKTPTRQKPAQEKAAPKTRQGSARKKTPTTPPQAAAE
jgi:hypothetical protein